MNRRVAGIGKYLLLPLMALLALSAAILYWLVATENGSSWILRRMAGALPYELRADEINGTLVSGLRLQRVHLVLPETTVDIAEIAGQWQLLSVLGGQLHVNRLHVDGVTVTSSAPTDSTGDSTSAQPQSWPSLATPVPIAVDDLAVSAARWVGPEGAARDLGVLKFKGIVSPLHYHIRKLSYAVDGLEVEASGRIASHFPYRHQLKFNWRLTTDQQDYTGSGALDGALTASQIDHRLAAPVTVESSGSVGLANRSDAVVFTPEKITFDLKNRWPTALLAFGDLLVDSSGAATLRGSAADYRVELDSSWQDKTGTDESPLFSLFTDRPIAEKSKSLFPAALSIRAEGTAEGLNLTAADITTATGAAHAKGGVSWADTPGWDLAVSTDQLNLAPLLAGTPLVLNGQLTSTGTFDNGAILANINTDSLAGNLDGHPFNAQLSASFEPGRLSLQNLSVEAGDNHLRGSGILGEENRLSWQLAANDLDILGLELSGELHSSGSFSGSAEHPVIDATITSKGMGYRNWHASGVNISASAQPSGRLQANAQIGGITSPVLPQTDIDLTAAGTLADHRLQLQASSADTAVNLSTRGNYDGKSWLASVENLAVTNPYSGRWKQTNRANIAIATDAVSIDKICLEQRGKICIDANLKGGSLAVGSALSAVDLSIVKPWLPDKTTISGTVDGDLRYSRLGDKQQGQFSLLSHDGQIVYSREEVTQLSHSLQLSLQGELQDSQFSARGDAAINDTASANFHLQTALDNRSPLSGTIDTEIQSLQWLEAFTGQLESPTGALSGSFALGGNLSSPKVTGNLQLKGFAASLPATGVRLAKGNATATLADDSSWNLSGSLAMNGGTATIVGSGTVDSLMQGDLSLALKGENLAVVDLPDTKIYATPDITLHRDNQRWDLSGLVEIPTAEITLRPLPEGAVIPSSDEVITPPLPKQQSRSTLSADLRVKLGKKVHIQGYGLDTRLEGVLSYKRKANAISTTRGKIDLQDGTYEAYGQQLTITEGHLLFQGNLENPGLNIVAERETPTATVGLRIGGVLKQLESQVFSDPALPPTEALTLLVTGKPPSGISQTDANLVMNAATALGISQSDWITSRLQHTFGLDVLSLESGDTYEESSLVVGKQLTPQLYVSYAQNLFSPQSSFILQYQISRHLGLKAESGETHSIDLHYRIEH